MGDNTVSETGFVRKSFARHRRLWVASVEAFPQAEHSPHLRNELGAGQQEARRGMVAWLQGIGEDAVADKAVRSVGSVQTALLSGVMMQWLTDPENAPSASEVLEGLRLIVAGICPAADEA